MILRPAPVPQRESWNTLQPRIERWKQEKCRLLDEWSLAVMRVYGTPSPYRRDAFQTVGNRYSALIDAVENHIATLQASAGEFTSQLERLLLRTGRQGVG